jgi:Protein of unknown function (DUF3313)
MAALLSGPEGCAGQGVTRTGFLTNYDQMTPKANHEDDLIHVNPALKAADYRVVIIDPVVWHPAADGPRLSPEIAARMATAFHDSPVKEFGAHFLPWHGDYLHRLRHCGKDGPWI